MNAPEPYWSDGEDVRLFLGDCLDVMRQMEPESVDAVVTDPPYGLADLSAAMVARALTAWLSGDREHVPDGRGGFMGRRWDRFVPPPAAWGECLRVLKPGGWLLAFAAPRTADLMTLSIRLAGFEIRDSIDWIYASGFPKGLDVSKAIDKAAGAQRPVVGAKASNRPNVIGQEPGGSLGGGAYTERLDTAPATPEAAEWDGWNVALKPAHEPIVLARKPLAGTVAQNVQRYGTGALNIDACRVGTGDSLSGGAAAKGSASHADGWDRPWKNDPEAVAAHAVRAAANVANAEALGRWPSNVVLSHSPACAVTGTQVIRGDSRAGSDPGSRPAGFGDVGAGSGSGKPNGTLHGDSVTEVWSCAPGCPVAELDRQSGVLTSGANPVRRNGDKFRDAYGEFPGQPDCAPHRGADSGGASRFFPVFSYQAKAGSGERPRLPDGTAWPTVKPLALMRWLVRLVTPPGGLILDPFCGTGTTASAAVIEGFRCVLIEQDPVAAELAKVRLAKPVQPVMFGGDL